MRKFIINILCVLSIGITGLCVLTWIDVSKLQRIDFKLKKETHIIAIGPSTTYQALDEEIIPGFENISRDGTDLMSIVPMLPRLLDENPQIDTLWISHGRFQFHPKSGGKGGANNQMQSYKYKLPFIFFDCKETIWRDYIKRIDLYAAILNPYIMDVITNHPKNLKDYGFGYGKSTKCDLFDSNKVWSVAWYDSLCVKHGGNVYTKEEILSNSYYNDYYTKRAIEICKERNVVPVLFFTPLYDFDRWCTYDGFCDYMASEYSPDCLISDYENFVFENDSICRRDVHHLNSKGAEALSAEIARVGLKTISVSEWILSKKLE